MPLDREEKLEIIKEFGTSETNVGQPEVQVGLLSKRIEQLSAHMAKAPKDNHSRKGLVSMVAKRRKLLNYIKKVRPDTYGELTKKLGLRK